MAVDSNRSGEAHRNSVTHYGPRDKDQIKIYIGLPESVDTLQNIFIFKRHTGWKSVPLA